MEKAGDFPKFVRNIAQTVCWLECSAETWLATGMANRVEGEGAAQNINKSTDGDHANALASVCCS